MSPLRCWTDADRQRWNAGCSHVRAVGARVRFLTSAVCGAVLLACGDGGDAAGPDGGPAVGLDGSHADAEPTSESPRWRPEDDAERLADAACTWYRLCAPSLFDRWGWDDEGCALAVRTILTEPLVRHAQLVDDGRARFDRGAFERCLAAHRAEGCARVSCEAFFVGLAPLDAPCTDSDECAGPSAYCTGESRAQCGVCARKKAGFVACALDAECASGRCDQRCLPPVGEGDLCDKVCTFGLCCPGSCVGFGMGSGTCRRRAGFTEVCDPTESSAARCDESLGLTCVDGRCAAVALAEVGEACDTSCWCADGASCLGGTCQPWPRSGEPCDGRCRGDDVCLRGHCQQAPREGEPCVLDLHCAPDLVCRGPDGDRTCRPRAYLVCE